MIFCYITDRTQFAGDDAARREALLARIEAAARAGVDFIQLREKDLPARDLERLAREAVARVRAARGESRISAAGGRGRAGGEDAGSASGVGGGRGLDARHPAGLGSRLLAADGGAGPRLLVNSRIDVALAAGADGVHLRADDLSAAEARRIAHLAGRDHFVIGVSCHTADEVRRAEAHGADVALFAPVFDTGGAGIGRKSGVGVGALAEACRRPGAVMPVLALGGITVENAAECLAAGVAGVAGIRLFQQGEPAEVVGRFRGLRARF